MNGSAYDPLKRVLDILVSSVVLVLSAPFQGAIAVLIRRRLGTPVLFRQQRPGKDEQIFELIKFRTMLAPDASKGLVTDEQRLTSFGEFLRSTSLDELPTLWNVVKGDMSLVGPRPLLVRYLDRYSPEQRRRHEVRPGVTGLAQVSGRNALGWDAKFAHDLEYVRTRSLVTDINIVIRTLLKVLRRDGITHAESATMTEFAGTEGRHGQ